MLSIPSVSECLQHLDDFLLYAATDCPSCFFHNRFHDCVDHSVVNLCPSFRLDLAPYEHFITLLRRARLPLCQLCFMPALQHHTHTNPSLCMYPSSVAPTAFLLWNHPSTLSLVIHVLRRVIPCEEINTELSMERYVDLLGNLDDGTPWILLLVGVYWFLYDKDGILPT